MTAPAAESRPHRVTSVGVGVAVCVVLVLVVLINPRLSWFALAGLAVGWLITEARHRPRRRWFAFALLVIVGVALVAFFDLVRTSPPTTQLPSAVPIHRVAMSSEMEYRSDREAFEITDTMVLSDQDIATICERHPPGRGEQSGGDAANVDPISAAALDSCARTVVEEEGWSYAGGDTGRPTFTRSRQSSVEVPFWPLSITHSVDTPSVTVGGLRILPDDDSTATVIGPKRFIRASSPPASSTESLLDEAGREAVKVPIGSDETFDDAVRLELVSPLARNPIVAPLLDFSWWASAQWIVLLIAAIFKDQVKDVLQWLFGAVARRADWRKKPDSASTGAGQAAKASLAGKADDGSPAGPEAVAGDPPGAAGGDA